jgi:hypothetical protein
VIIELNPFKLFAKKEVVVVAQSGVCMPNAAAPVLPSKAAEAEESVMSTATGKVTFLDHVGNFFKGLLHIGVEVAKVAEPFIAVEFPEVLPIYGSAIGLAITAQATAASTTGTGTQKLAQVTASLVPQVQAWAKQNGIVWNDADITKWTSAVVDTINLIPAPTVAPVAATPKA